VGCTDEEIVEERSMAVDIAAVATPLAILAQPIVGAWADQHFGQDESPSQDAPPLPQEPEK
jgi:hypothetical protein